MFRAVAGARSCSFVRCGRRRPAAQPRCERGQETRQQDQPVPLARTTRRQENCAMATPEDPSTDRVDVKAALWAFGRRYLHALESQDAPMRSIAIGGWRAHPQAADLFMPLETRLPPSGIGEWVEYRAI